MEIIFSCILILAGMNNYEYRTAFPWRKPQASVSQQTEARNKSIGRGKDKSFRDLSVHLITSVIVMVCDADKIVRYQSHTISNNGLTFE
jgi:hypothetical protein